MCVFSIRRLFDLLGGYERFKRRKKKRRMLVFFDCLRGFVFLHVLHFIVLEALINSSYVSRHIRPDFSNELKRINRVITGFFAPRRRAYVRISKNARPKGLTT